MIWQGRKLASVASDLNDVHGIRPYQRSSVTQTVLVEVIWSPVADLLLSSLRFSALLTKPTTTSNWRCQAELLAANVEPKLGQLISLGCAANDSPTTEYVAVSAPPAPVNKPGQRCGPVVWATAHWHLSQVTIASWLQRAVSQTVNSQRAAGSPSTVHINTLFVH